MSHPNHSFPKSMLFPLYLIFSIWGSIYQNYQSYQGFPNGHPNHSHFHNSESPMILTNFPIFKIILPINMIFLINRDLINFDYSNSNMSNPFQSITNGHPIHLIHGTSINPIKCIHHLTHNQNPMGSHPNLENHIQFWDQSMWWVDTTIF